MSENQKEAENSEFFDYCVIEIITPFQIIDTFSYTSFDIRFSAAKSPAVVGDCCENNIIVEPGVYFSFFHHLDIFLFT